MDDIIKLIQELMSKKPTPKGGIADTVAGVEFIGKKLSKEQVGNFTIIGSKLTDASRFRPFDVRNVGRDNRYMYMRDYADELQSNFEKTLKFIQDNPDIRLTKAQKDNVFYNLGVYRRVNAEKTKLEKGYIDEGKNPEEIYKKTDDERPLEELPFVKVLERTKKTIDEFQKKVKETEDIFKPPSAEELSAGQIRYNKLYDGPGYTSGNSSLYRGYGSSFLPRLHEKGIIKLDDEIYQNLKQGKHHYGGADFFAPDPIRIWRKHFGDDVFKKLDNFDPDNEDIFQWLSRNNVQPTNRVGPKNALEYMNSTEIGQRLTDEAELLNKYKNPASQGDNAKYYYVDKPDQRMERITYHGENIQGYETALQKMDPDAYNKYAAEFRQATNDANVIPFNKDEGIRAIAADSEEGKEITKGILDLADRSSGENIVALADPVSDAISAIKGLEPMDAMKEANLVAGKQGKYADLSDEQVNKIIEDTNDHIFERDPIEPEEFAKGGIAGLRKNFRGGGQDAGAGSDFGSFSQGDNSPAAGGTTGGTTGGSTGGQGDGPSTPQEIDIGSAPQVFDINTVGDPSLNPQSINVGGENDYTPSFDPNYTTDYTPEPSFLETLLEKSKKVYNNPFVRLGLGAFLPGNFKDIQTAIAALGLGKKAFDNRTEIKDFITDDPLSNIQDLLTQKAINDELNRKTTFDSEIQGLDIKDMYKKGGRVDFNRGSGPAGAGLASLTPYQEEYYNDKIIRDNMDFIREDMSLYFDKDTRSDFQKYIDAMTRDDVYNEYDEKKGYTGMFKENFTTKDGKDITIPYKPDRNLDIQGLLQLFDESDRGVSSSDETIFNSSDILGRFSSKERDV